MLSFEWSRCLGPQGTRFPFWWVLSFKWSHCCGPRGIFIFYSALLLVKSMFWTSRHEFCFPYGGCSHLSEVGVVELEANLFLTVLSFEKESLVLILEARLVLTLLLGAWKFCTDIAWSIGKKQILLALLYVIFHCVIFYINLGSLFHIRTLGVFLCLNMLLEIFFVKVTKVVKPMEKCTIWHEITIAGRGSKASVLQ